MKKILHIAGWIVVTLVATVPCLATDSAVLRNGFSIRHERRQVIGTITRLYTSHDNASFVDIPTAEIDHFEAEPAEAVSLKPAPISSGKGALASSLNSPGYLAPAMDLNEVVNAASGTYHLDPDLVNSVIRAESGFNVRAVSPKGAQGLMQLMPGTASQLGVQNVFDPQANVEGGSRYLRELLERYNFDLIKALAAYNAGPQRVEQYGGVPPYYETKAYVARIVRDYNRKLAAKSAQQSIGKKSLSRKSSGTSDSLAKRHKSTAQSQAKVASAQPSE